MLYALILLGAIFLPRTLLSWSVPSRPRKNFKIAADSVEDYIKEARNFCQTEESILYLSMNLMKKDYEHEKEWQLLLKEKESELLLKEKESELLLKSELLLQDQRHQMQIQEAYLMKLLSVATLRFAYNRFIIFAFAVLCSLICFQY
jgi:hypothetical protein